MAVPLGRPIGTLNSFERLDKNESGGLVSHQKNKGTPSSFDGMPFFSSERLLNDSDVDCGGALFTLLYVKGNPVAFSQRLEAVSIDA